MEQTKELSKKNAAVVKKPNITQTLKMMPYGETMEFRASKFGAYHSVTAIISRLNRSGRYGTYFATTTDNGTTFTVTRN